MPQVSVIIPVHNTAPYLKRCVDSVINQTMKSIEIILVDNLSDDGSGQICDEYALVDDRIKVLHLDKAGPSIARNAGISIASAPYIGFVDSDDFILPMMYEEMLDALLLNNSEMVYCNLCQEFADGHIEDKNLNSGRIDVRSPKDVIIDVFCEKVSNSCCTKLFKKELFQNLLFPVGAFFEDHDTFYKWANLCHKISWIDKTYYYYYQREGSTCHSIDLNKRFDYFMAEYNRLFFVHQNPLFTKNEQKMLMPLIMKNSCWIFKTFMEEPLHRNYKDKILKMRKAFRKGLALSKEEIGPKYYKRLVKIVYFWPVYYCLRYKKFL